MNGAVNEVLDDSRSKAFVLWDEALTFLVNFPRQFLKELDFTEKVMEMGEAGKTKFLREELNPYSLFQRDGVDVVVTLQGYWWRACLWAAQNGVKFEFKDFRPPDLIPDPRLDLMFGFRFNQEALTRGALLKGYSGMIEAPTRFGKSTIIRNILRAYPGIPWVVFAPGKSLLRQTVKEMREQMPERQIKLMGGGSCVRYQSTDITVCSMDSAHKLDPASIRGVLVDEPHAIASRRRSSIMPSFPLARKIAVGATLDGRYDGRDKLLEGFFGPRLARVSYREAVTMGAVCQIKVMMIRFKVDKISGDRQFAFRRYILQNPLLHKLIGACCQAIPDGDQTLVFIKQEKQGLAVQSVLGNHVPLVMDKVLTDKERIALTAKVESNELSLVVCSDIFVQGVTFHELRYLINACGGGPSTSALQRPGRLAEIRPDKRFGVMIDFQPYIDTRTGQRPKSMLGIEALIREAAQRLEVYRKIGYEVDIVEQDNVATWIKQHNTHL